MTSGDLAARRARHLAPSLGLSYADPLEIVRGEGAWLYDAKGDAYLDCVNNVCHVGHCHPTVVAAAAEQMAVLNTNTRYLHENAVRLAERLCGLLPDPLSVCFFVCSGSEANELALRLARTATGRHDVAVVDGAYHGNTSSLIELSPYKFNGRGGRGRADHVHVVPTPDPFRSRVHPLGAAFACDPQRVTDAAREAEPNGGLAALFCESLLGCAGQVVLPPAYLAAAFEHARAAGALCVADEVQVGFGRVGSHFWGFETQRAVPDIVTLGKPMGNGHPLAAVVTTPAVAAAFANGMEYFNTFGGNPVSCAVGSAVLDVIESEGLQRRASEVGALLLERLGGLEATAPLIGDVRGLGLFIGVELVLDRTTLEPAAAEATRVVEAMKDRGVLLSTDGPGHNVIKIKPPLAFGPAEAERVAAELATVLAGL
ncbi:MAG: aminotransferase class III-fold pyridoxal phosphate-dependent enzyme [Planctomycetota bacterium]|jgi:4-aminobutyrate aminotransferase-like enzyme|nr:aminotransferase class III-fold pyridoxal phosphate-dependent enzyme [Planctomycetota bacterium]MDP6762273.1 aminotransferase class III-fold pyridoxal phosphate-dependent enzyme [Planctomycetota bacterium]MDP6990017.1 aminotransferase class III-fold pyridoxal phosphate-dependent enzyme [Planctomycetota bacterium]